ncbi:MAG: hypothetical protein V8Q42_09120 [Anaerovoracaceae bacterium]
MEYSDMDASGENTAPGKTVRDLINFLRTVKCTFRTMTAEEALPLLAVLNESQLKIAYHDTFTRAYSGTRIIIGCLFIRLCPGALRCTARTRRSCTMRYQ